MKTKQINWTTSIFMVVVHSLSLLAFLPQFFSWSAVGVFVLLYYITLCLGITIGYHRLLSHRSFEVPRWLERFFTLCGTLSLQHGVLEWVGRHRLHHIHSDTEKDHHNSNKGFWWSHMGWLFFHPENDDYIKVVGDLRKDPVILWLDKNYVLPTIILGVILWWFGGWSWVIWGIFLRLVVCYHVTWFVNSFSHLPSWGTQPFNTGDNSTNLNKFFSVITFGESNHNNHHFLSHSCKHGFLRGQWDITYFHLKFLRKIGLVWGMKRPYLTNQSVKDYETLQKHTDPHSL